MFKIHVYVNSQIINNIIIILKPLFIQDYRLLFYIKLIIRLLYSFKFSTKVSTETPVQARVYQVKKADKTEAYKKKVTWLLRELKVVDGKSSSKVGGEVCPVNIWYIYKYMQTSGILNFIFIWFTYCDQR